VGNHKLLDSVEKAAGVKTCGFFEFPFFEDTFGYTIVRCPNIADFVVSKIRRREK
jgi:hypothetical protein